MMDDMTFAAKVLKAAKARYQNIPQDLHKIPGRVNYGTLLGHAFKETMESEQDVR